MALDYEGNERPLKRGGKTERVLGSFSELMQSHM